MLAVSAPMTCVKSEEHHAVVGSTDEADQGGHGDTDYFDFAVEAGLLEDIDFGDFFLRLCDGDILPDLEVDPSEIFAEEKAGIEAGQYYMSVDLQPSPALDGFCQEEEGAGSADESGRLENSDDAATARAGGGDRENTGGGHGEQRRGRGGGEICCAAGGGEQ